MKGAQDGKSGWVDVDRAAALGLSSRQCDVLCGIARGWTNEQIALALGLAFATAKGHVARTLHQLGARDRAHAVAIAYDHELLRTTAARRQASEPRQAAA